MNLSPPILPEFVRRPAAWERAVEADELMRECRLCAWDCGVDRTAGPAGHCHAPARSRLFQQRLEWVGEEHLVPTRLVNFSGCNFRCSFCLTGRDSQDASRGELFDIDKLANALQAEREHYRSVTIEGGEPSVFLPDALRAVSLVPPGVPVVWKTNAYASADALEMLKGVIDVFLADYKFGNDQCAARLAGVPNYLENTRKNLLWGDAHSCLIVRHLIMPGHIDCCLVPMLQWLKSELPHARLSIITGFVPVWNSRRTPELLKALGEDDLARVHALVTGSGLEMVPWSVTSPAAAGPAPGDPVDDHIYIDKGGRIRVPFMTAALRQCLQQIENEIPTAVNLQ